MEMDIKAILDLLSTGGWGVAALAIFALYQKDKACSKAHEKTEELAERIRVALTDDTIAINRIAAVVEGIRDTIRQGARR